MSPAKIRVKTPEYIRMRNLKERYGITPEQYADMLEKQGGGCAVCGSEDPGNRSVSFNVDHDHDCCPGVRSCGKCLRGLLCQNCNLSLGILQDDVVKIRAAANYVSKHRRKRIRECLKSNLSTQPSVTSEEQTSASPSKRPRGKSASSSATRSAAASLR